MPDSHSPSTRRLALLSCNIQAGSSTRRYRDYVTRSWSHVLPTGRGKRSSLASIAELAEPFDIVGLQEADAGSLRSGFTNQTHYLAEAAGFPYWSHQPNRRMGGIAHSANGLLSRLVPNEVSDYALPSRIPGRGALVARYGSGAETLSVAIAHLSLRAQARRAQVAFLAELLADAPHAVLMGDFNCPADAPEMQALYRHTTLQPPQCAQATFPSWAPLRAIDHILTSERLLCTNLRALPAALSDHLAIAVELQVPESALAD